MYFFDFNLKININTFYYLFLDIIKSQIPILKKDKYVRDLGNCFNLISDVKKVTFLISIHKITSLVLTVSFNFSFFFLSFYFFIRNNNNISGIVERYH